MIAMCLANRDQRHKCVRTLLLERKQTSRGGDRRSLLGRGRVSPLGTAARLFNYPLNDVRTRLYLLSGVYALESQLSISVEFKLSLGR